jgi:putative membrane protein
MVVAWRLTGWHSDPAREYDSTMIRMLIRVGIHLLANAIGLIVAAVVLSGMTITGAAFVIAVLIFTVVEVVADPLVTKIALRSVPTLRGGVALVTTLLGLLITTWLSSGLRISGATTWVLATVIVWLAALLADVILPVFLVKNAVDTRKA